MKNRRTHNPSQRRPGPGKPERYIQPSILMVLYQEPSYGYELIQNLQQFGFLKGQAPPGMIYRHLRQMEEDGLVSSQWETEDAGAAKRVYRITDDGKEMLRIWVGYMEGQAEHLLNFIKEYRGLERQGR